MGSAWLIFSPTPTPQDQKTECLVWSLPPTPGPAPAPWPWRWDAVEGTADFGGVGLGWGVGNVCMRRRLPRAVGEPASLPAGQPLPRACPGLPSPLPLQVLGCAAPPRPCGTPGLLLSAGLHLTPPFWGGPAATPPRLTLADPQPTLGTKRVAIGMKAKLAGHPLHPRARSCPQPPGPAPAPPPPAPKEGAGTLRRGGMNQTLRG